MFKKWAVAVILGWAAIAWAQVDLNKATEIELDGLRGLGPAATREILSEREKNPFKDWPDVMQRVKGIGSKKAVSLSAQGLRVHGQGYENPKGDATR